MNTPPRKAQAVDSRSGEEQPRFLLFIFIVIALGAIIGTIIFVVILASTHASKTVLNEQKDRGLYSASVVQGPFTILSTRYSDSETASCGIGATFTRPAALIVRFKTILVPDTCSIFIDGRLLSTERKLSADCGSNCAFTEYNRQFTLKENDYRDDHVVRMCCDDICIERVLEKLCSQTTAS